MFCKKCGNPIPAETRFCKRCGAQVQSAPQTDGVRYSQPPEEPQQEGRPRYPQQAAPRREALGDARPPYPPRHQQETSRDERPPYQSRYQQEAPEDEQPQYQQRYRQEASWGPSRVAPPRSALASDVLSTIRGFFSPAPGDAVSLAAGSYTHIWAILAAAWCLCMGFLVRTLPWNLVLYLDSMPEDLAGSFFGYGVLLAAGSFLLLSVGVKALFAVYKRPLSVVGTLNLAGAALLPAIAGVLGTAVVGYVYVSLSFVLLFAGFIGTLLCLYAGIEQEIGPQQGLFWPYLIFWYVYLVVIMLILKKVIGDALAEAFGSAMDGLGGLLNLF